MDKVSELNRLGADNIGVGHPDKEIHLPGDLGPTIELIVWDTQTKEVTNRIGPKASESFTEQFIRLLFIQMSAPGHCSSQPVVDVSGVTNYIYDHYTLFSSGAGIGSILYGIVCGTGAVAPTISDRALGNIILHDAAPPTAGRLQYSAVTFGAPSADPTTSQFTITRNLANASGGAITPTEFGLYVLTNIWSTLAPFNKYFMTIRDVIGGGIAVPNGQTLTINYRLQGVI
ncbi:MAG: hypothetical protein PHQ43_07900 [Dehalococcoidales bacterium]|nr:hypothetical protein [Dehalococcoidales bacterium]